MLSIQNRKGMANEEKTCRKQNAECEKEGKNGHL